MIIFDNLLNNINWNNIGLIPVIVQDIYSNNILMLAWMNKIALIQTIKTKRAIYWSRSRKKIWKKGEKSYCIQKVYKIFLDCDNDTILIKVKQINNISCHTGHETCFFKKLNF